MLSRTPLSEPFESYLQHKKKTWAPSSFSSCQCHLRYFSKYLTLNNLNLSRLTYEDIQGFSKYLKTIPEKKDPVTRLTTRKAVQTALVKLCKSGQIKNDYTKLFPDHKHFPHLNATLPKYAEEYLDLLKSVHATSSVQRYRIDVGRFHIFLKTEKIQLQKIGRNHLEKLLKNMKSRGLSAPTRVRAILTIRLYLYWLREHGLISATPENLLLRRDFPKMPKRLPRPFSSEVDAQLKKTFLDGQDIFFDGLLLMRFTGIRIGELIMLEFDCLKTDWKKNYYLKVPLGKLKTERMVPLAKTSIELIHKIQAQTKIHAKNNKIQKVDRLILTPRGRGAIFNDFRARMDEIQTNFPPEQSAKSHQLRHSCATELLNNGMSLVALKEFLGHKDIKMTLKYAAVAPETVRTQFNEATEKIQKRYKEKQIEIDNPMLRNPLNTGENIICDLIVTLKNHPESNSAKSKALIRRLKRIRKDIAYI